MQAHGLLWAFMQAAGGAKHHLMLPYLTTAVNHPAAPILTMPQAASWLHQIQKAAHPPTSQLAAPAHIPFTLTTQAALGVNTSLFSFAFVVFNFLSVATTPTIAAAVSAGRRDQAGQVTYQAGAIATLLGLAVSLGLTLYSDQSLQLMGLDASDPALFEMAKGYLAIRALAAPAVLLTTVGQGAFRGLADMRSPLAITLATNLVHLALDPLLMFKMHMGLQGAALSTAASEGLAAALYLGMLWQRRDQLGLWPPPAIDLAKAGQTYIPLLRASSAVLMRTGVLLGTKTLASAVAARLGPTSIASHQVMYQLWMLSSMMVDSLAVSGQTLVAVALGRSDMRGARQISNRLLQLGLGLGGILALSLGAAAPLWPHVFTSDADVLAGINQIMPTAIVLLPVNSLVYVLDGVLVGASDFKFMMLAMVGVSSGAAGLLMMVDSQHWGLPGVWTALSVLMMGRLLTLAARYQSQSGPLPPSSAVLSSMDDVVDV
jgi:putative MATE family efflux protein